MATLSVLIILSASACLVGTTCDSEDMVWCERMDFQILLDHMSQHMANSADDCKNACLEDSSGTCKAVDYSDIEKQCQLFDVTMFDEDIETKETEGVQHYWRSCDENCTSVDDTTDSEDEDQSFLDWITDDPVWFALIGTGLLSLLLVIIILVLICQLKKRNTQKSVSSHENPTTLDRNFVYIRDTSREEDDHNQSKEHQSEISVDAK